jgi:hypothetical protein
MRHTLRDHGYLFIDHGNSPGVPAWMARLAGLDPAQVAQGKRMDIKTLCCAHCKTHVIPNHKRPNSDRATCAKCGHHYICDFCAFAMTQPEYNHTPFEKKLDAALSGKPIPATPLGSPKKLIMP